MQRAVNCLKPVFFHTHLLINEGKNVTEMQRPIKKIHSSISVALYLNFQLNIPNIINKWALFFFFFEPCERKLTKAQQWSRRATGALPVPVLTFVESAQLLFCYNLLCHPLWLTPQLTAQSAAGQGRRRTVPQDLYLFMSENDIATAEANQAVTCALNWGWEPPPTQPTNHSLLIFNSLMAVHERTSLQGSSCYFWFCVLFCFSLVKK